MSGLYDSGRNLFALGALSWQSDGSTIRAFLVTAGYTPNLARDRFLSAVPVSARVGNNGSSKRENAPQLALLDPSAGVCDAEDVTFELVPRGTVLNAVVLFEDDGSTDAGSPLIAYIDTGAGLPIIANGADVMIEWNNGHDRIFKL